MGFEIKIKCKNSSLRLPRAENVFMTTLTSGSISWGISASPLRRSSHIVLRV